MYSLTSCTSSIKIPLILHPSIYSSQFDAHLIHPPIQLSTTHPSIHPSTHPPTHPSNHPSILIIVVTNIFFRKPFDLTIHRGSFHVALRHDLVVEGQEVNGDGELSCVVLLDAREEGLHEEEARHPEGRWWVVLQPFLMMMMMTMMMMMMEIMMMMMGSECAECGQWWFLRVYVAHTCMASVSFSLTIYIALLPEGALGSASWVSNTATITAAACRKATFWAYLQCAR